MEYGFDGEIDIEIGPVQVVRRLKLNVKKLAYGCISKPRKIFESKKDLLLLDQKPEAMFRDIGYFNC